MKKTWLGHSERKTEHNKINLETGWEQSHRASFEISWRAQRNVERPTGCYFAIRVP